MINDNELIARIVCHQDKHAFATLIKKYQVPIRQFLRRLTAGQHAEADDIAQETFIRIYQKIATYSGKASFSTWAHKIAYHCFLRSQQKAYHRHEQLDVDFSLIESTKYDIDKDIMVEQLMQALDIEQRTCLTLSLSAGMSHQEIATITEFPLGTVKSHINRGKQRLMKVVKP
ncbi:sigma-70 family RNA polymerase sigma factor [Thalassotalea sp. G2M2-11]|uniref:sigma-70 family RNA polymerase sigma factor n=1 Tax=Thalassotalea sp. G2M2-11 TaxID=2787627 RepID=UPI0019D0E6CC